MLNHIVTEQELTTKITAIRNTNNDVELAAILHASPEWGHMSEAMIKLFYQEIDKQRIYLDEIRRIANMNIEEREKLIPYYSKYPEKSALVTFAKNIQAQVVSMIENLQVPDSLDALNTKALETVIYLRKNYRATNAEHSTQIEYLSRLNSKITSLEQDVVQQIINNQDQAIDEKIAQLSQRVADLRIKQIKARDMVGDFNDYVMMLRLCKSKVANALVELRKEAGQKSAELLPSFKPLSTEPNGANLGNVDYARKLLY